MSIGPQQASDSHSADVRIAELEARLAMKDEALKLAARKIAKHSEDHRAVCYEWCILCRVENARSANAADATAFLQRVEQRGAAKELRATTDRHKREIVDQNELVHEVVASAVLYARAAELERP